jgi:hypothetical protein
LLGNSAQFSGQLTLVSAQKPDGSQFPLTLDVSPSWASWLGALAICLGVVVSFFATRYLRNLVSRDQLRLPARVIAEDLGRLQSRLQEELKDWTDEEKQRIKECPARIIEWINNLSSEALEGRQFIPSRWPIPLRANDDETNAPLEFTLEG